MALSTPASIQSGSETIVAGDGTTINITISAVTVANSIVMYTMRNGDVNGRLQRHVFTAALTSTTNLQLVRHEASFADTIVIEWTVLEFASSNVTIQTGSVDCTNAAEDVTISAVTVANTFPITSFKTSQIDPNGDVIFNADITSTTNLRINHGIVPTTGESVVQYQVVESADFTVQKGTISFTFTDGQGSRTSSISAVDLSKTFLIHGGISSTKTNIINRLSSRLKFTNTTTVQADRTLYGSEPDMDVIYYAVSLADGQAVEDFDSTILDTATTPSAQPSWTALSTSNSAVMAGYVLGNIKGDESADDLPEDHYISIKLNAGADGVTVSRTGNDGQREISGYVVDWTVSAGGVTGKANPLYGPFGGPLYGTIG